LKDSNEQSLKVKIHFKLKKPNRFGLEILWIKQNMYPIL